jgi:ABC-type branched-subunit amino acid transport system substrate-binding protein
VIRESFLPGSEDFRSLFTKMRSKGADALFLLPQGEPGLLSIFGQLESFGWKVPLLGTFAPGSAAFLQAVGKGADGGVRVC